VQKSSNKSSNTKSTSQPLQIPQIPIAGLASAPVATSVIVIVLVAVAVAVVVFLTIAAHLVIFQAD